MKASTYAFGALSVLSFIVVGIAVAIHSWGYCDIGPVVLGIFIFVASVIGFIFNLPKRNKKKEKKPGKRASKAEEEA